MDIYDIPVTDRDGNQTDLKAYAGQVLLIVNTATACGFTPQYQGLQALYDRYKDRGFSVLDFPSNQFGGQAPGTMDEIDNFCTVNYGCAFPRFHKVHVNGKQAAPLFRFLKGEQGGLLGDAIKWNFTKFLVDRQGRVVRRFAPADKPESIEQAIEELL